MKAALEDMKIDDLQPHLAALVESSDDAIISKTLNGNIIYWNKGAENLYGYITKEVLGQSINILNPDQTDSEHDLILKRFNSGEKLETFETKRVRKDGNIVDVSLTVSPIFDDTKKLIGFSTIARDITGRTRHSEYARSLIEASLDPLVTISADGKITDVNEATIKVTGCSRNELLSTDFSDYFTEPLKAREGYLKVFEEGSVRDYPLTIRHKSGKLVYVLYNATVYRDAEGKVLGVFAAARDITEQRESSQYARSLIEASLDPLVTISADGKITDVNEATIEATGLDRESLIGTDFSKYFTEPEKAQEGYQKVFEEGSVRDYPLTIRHKSGKLVYVLYNATVYRDAEGKVLGVFAAARDITEQRESSQYARSLIEASLDPLVTISADGKITDVNEATIEATGLDRESLIGTDFSKYFTEPEKAQEGYQKVFEEGTVRDYPLTIRHKSGKLVHVVYNATVYRDAEGKVLGVFAAARDITEQRESSQYARSLIEASLDPLVTISADGKITDVNEATIEATGLDRESLIGTDFSKYFTEPEKAQEGYQKVFEEGLVTDYALTIRHKSGKLMDVLYNASVYKDTKGKVVGVFAAARDITAQKESSQYARSLLEASVDPLVTISSDGKITDVNEATIKATGLDRKGLIGTDFSSYFTEPEKARDGYMQVFEKGIVTDYPLTIRHQSGKLTEVLYNASVYKDTKGNVLGVFAAARDITAQKSAEKDAAEKEKKLVRLVELERFQKLTIGRELKMIELKQKIADLEDALAKHGVLVEQ